MNHEKEMKDFIEKLYLSGCSSPLIIGLANAKRDNETSIRDISDFLRETESKFKILNEEEKKNDKYTKNAIITKENNLFIRIGNHQIFFDSGKIKHDLHYDDFGKLTKQTSTREDGTIINYN